MTPEQAARRWRQAQVAQSRRDVELETFPTTAGSASKVSHPMFGNVGAAGSPARARLPGLVTEPPAPEGFTSWGTWEPAAIEHVGGGYHLLAINLKSQDDGWAGALGGTEPSRWAIAIWLLRPDGTFSAPWVSDGNNTRPYTQGGSPGDVAIHASPYGEPTQLSTPKLARWQEGALLWFTIFTNERQHVDDLSGFWPQSAAALDVPWGANVYRWVGHDGTDPVVGPPLELYAGGDDDFATDGDWSTGGGTEFDDGTIEGFDVATPSADTNTLVYGTAYNSNRHRMWLLDKDTDHNLSLAARTTFPGDLSPGDPGGATRIAADRWLVMTDAIGQMQALLFNAKTGTVLDTAEWDSGVVLNYYLPYQWGYYAGNHLHFDGQATFAGWVKQVGTDISHRHITLTVDGDVLTAGDIVEWAVEPDVSPAGIATEGQTAGRWVETCEGCLRLIDSGTRRQQALFERRRVKAALSPLPSPEFDPGGEAYVDQRIVPSSHPVGFMWASNVSISFDLWDTVAPIRPKLIRYPA